MTHVPIVEEWVGEGTSLTVNFDLVNAFYVSLYKDTAVAEATVVSSQTSTIAAASSAPKFCQFIASVIESKSNTRSCTLNTGADTEGTYFEGYAYQASMSGSTCVTTAEKKTILVAVEKCANRLHSYGATCGCCTFTLGGTWTGHLVSLPSLSNIQ